MRQSAELLIKAADYLDDHRSPFCDEFLRENEVTLDQAMSLGEQLAIGARIMAHGIENPRSEQGMAMLLTMARD